jgi:ribosomal protein S1
MNKTIIEYKEPDSMYDYLFDQPKGKYNTNVKLSNEDKANGTRILCKEPYAQSLYNLYNKVENYDSIVSKDLNIGEVYEVSAISYNTKDRLVSCEEINSKTSVYVPYSELKEGESITSGKPFSVMITQNRKGVMYGSVKKCAKIVNFKKLDQYLTDGTIFDVKIINLIKGGFIAMFDDSLECFIPGAHAAANIIYDFNSYIGRTIKVMVDNYDQASNLYVVSHKKYIKNILPQKINDLEFGKKYQGKLTSQPTKFGIFVEFNEIFTGLIHIAEFDNYNHFRKLLNKEIL